MPNVQVEEVKDLEQLQTTVDDLKTLIDDELNRQSKEREAQEKNEPERKKEIEKQRKADEAQAKSKVEFESTVKSILSKIEANTTPSAQETSLSEDLSPQLNELIEIQKEQLRISGSQYQAQLTILSIVLSFMLIAIVWSIAKSVGGSFRDILR